MLRPLLQNKGGIKRYKPASSLLSRRNKVLGVEKIIVFDSKMGMHKFKSTALLFSKVAYIVKADYPNYLKGLRGLESLKGLRGPKGLCGLYNLGNLLTGF